MEKYDCPLEFEKWCKENKLDVTEYGIEEAYKEYLEDFIVDITISGIEKNGNIRVEIENGEGKKYLAWYTDVNNI